MLSILIPTYNYNIFPLAAEVHRQCIECGIVFEIIALDDGSKSALNIENQKISSFSNSSFTMLPENTGRSAIRNLLAKKASYDWLLFLDADTMPEDKIFIKKYMQAVALEEKVVYGGICYQQNKPHDKESLRWVYGKEREAPDATARNKKPYVSLLTLNFMISKPVFEKVKFNEQIPNLRHEDTLFSYNLMQAGIKIEHINNRVMHHGLESSEIFMQKSEESLTGLKYLLENELLPCNYTRIGEIYCKLKKSGLNSVIAFVFRLFQKPMRKSLTGRKPSLFIFDMYRLGYLCNIR